MSRALGLTDAQLQQVQQAAQTLLPSARSAFLESLSHRLGSEPTDETLQLAISQVLSINKLPSFCGGK
jgi:hypothetical protein